MAGRTHSSDDAPPLSPRSRFPIVGLLTRTHRRGYRLRYESCAKLDADGQDFGRSDALVRPWRPLHGAARGFGDRDHRHQHVGGDGLDGAEADHGLLRALLLMLARRRGGSRRSRSPTSPWCRGPEQSPSPASCSCWHPGPSDCSARARRRARARVSRSSTAGRRSFAQRTPLQPSLRGCCE